MFFFTVALSWHYDCQSRRVALQKWYLQYLLEILFIFMFIFIFKFIFIFIRIIRNFSCFFRDVFKDSIFFKSNVITSYYSSVSEKVFDYIPKWFTKLKCFWVDVAFRVQLLKKEGLDVHFYLLCLFNFILCRKNSNSIILLIKVILSQNRPSR